VVGSAQNCNQISYHCHNETSYLVAARESLLNFMHSIGVFDILNKKQPLQIQEIKRNRLVIERNNNSDDHLRGL